MQQDLKDGEDILRITKGALEENNISRARELIKDFQHLKRELSFSRRKYEINKE